MIKVALANTVWIAAPVMLWLAGCAGDNVVAPVAGEAPPARPVAATVRGSAATVHHVVKGDTLYSIAFQHGLDYRQIARWNRIADPYLIIIGQRPCAPIRTRLVNSHIYNPERCSPTYIKN